MTFSTTVSDFRTRYYIRLDTSATERETDFDPLLKALISQAHADSASIYRFDQDNGEFTAAAAHASRQPSIRNAGISFTAAASRWLYNLEEAAQGNPAFDECFERFPERLQFGIETILVAPFRGDGGIGDKLLGILTLGRVVRNRFAPEAVQLARRTARLIGAVIERDELYQRLQERKHQHQVAK